MCEKPVGGATALAAPSYAPSRPPAGDRSLPQPPSSRQPVGSLQQLSSAPRERRGVGGRACCAPGLQADPSGRGPRDFEPRHCPVSIRSPPPRTPACSGCPTLSQPSPALTSTPVGPPERPERMFSRPSASICSLHCCPGQIHFLLLPLSPARGTLLSPRWVTLPSQSVCVTCLPPPRATCPPLPPPGSRHRGAQGRAVLGSAPDPRPPPRVPAPWGQEPLLAYSPLCPQHPDLACVGAAASVSVGGRRNENSLPLALPSGLPTKFWPRGHQSVRSSLFLLLSTHGP